MVLLKASSYSGSGAWLDESGYGRHATLENGTAAKNTAGNAIVLNGSTNWQFPNINAGNSWTANVWYKKTANNGNGGCILGQQYSGGVHPINMYIGDNQNNGVVHGGFYDGIAWRDGSVITLTIGVWVNIQVTWDGTNMATYINSMLLGTTTPGGTAPNGTIYRIGRRWDGDGISVYFVTGEIGEVRIYNYPISQRQVQLDFTSSYLTYIWSPSSITGLKVWLDANDTNTFTLNGSKITTWADKSGNSNNATGVNGPILLQNPNTVSFNGNIQYLTTPYTAYAAAETTFVVYSLYADGQMSLVESSITGGRQLQNLSGKGTSLARNNQAWLAYGTVNSSTNTTYIGECLYNSSGINIYVNGAVSVSNTTNPAFTAGLTVIGGSPGQSNYYLNGTISEVLIYNSVLTADQRKLVEGYLAWKWSAQASLPTSHPYYSFPPNYPTAPASLASSAITTTGFTVSWSGNLYASSYTYTIDGVSVTPSTDNGVASKSAVFTGLTPGTLYAVVVTAVSGLGTADSSSFNVTTTAVPPTAPTSLNATSVTSTGFTLGWSGGQYATSYTYSTTPTTNNGVASKSAIFTGLTPGNTYSITVTATNTAASTTSSAFSIKLPPSAITDLSSTSTTQTGFTLAWLGGSTATSYTYSLNGSLVTPSTNNGVASKSAIFTGLTASTTYAVIINATNSGGYTTSSSSFNVSTAPANPTGITLTSITQTGFTLGWNLDSAATSYTYSLGAIAIPSSYTSTSATFTGLNAGFKYGGNITARNSSGSSSAVNFSIILVPSKPTVSLSSSTSSSFSLIWSGQLMLPFNHYTMTYTFTLNGSPATPATLIGTTATFTGLSPVVPYSVIVIATNSSGSTSSDALQFVLPPSKPTEVTASALTANGFTLSWTGGLSATSYTYVLDPLTPLANITTDLENKKAVLTNLTPASTYIVKVVSVNENGSSESDPISILLPPSMPRALVASAVGKTGFTVTWTGGQPATSYSYTLNGRATVPSVDNGVLSKIAVFSDLQPGVTYTVIVTAINSSGSTSSYGFSIMTLPPPGVAVDPSQSNTTAHMLWNAPIINETVNTTPVPQKVIKLGEGGYANPEARQAIKNTLANGPKSATCSKMTLDGNVTITWEPNDNSRPILGYGLIFRPSSGGPTIQHSAYPFLTSLTISGLDPTMTYTCEVSAVNDLGWSMPPTLTGVVTAM